MKRNKILGLAILPLTIFTALAFTNLPPQKGKEDKGDKPQKHESDNSKGQKPNQKDGNSGADKNQNHQPAQRNDHKSSSSKHADYGSKGHDEKGRQNGKSDQGDHKQDHSKMNHGKGNSNMMNGKRDMDIDWNLNDFSNRKHPKDQKKVTICHNPSGNGNNGVTISVSENALKAHMNHGDNKGNCNIDYSSRWSPDYVKARENVYNTYEQSWERMSYGEALVRLAANKILGIRTNLDRDRNTLSSAEIQRRETLIRDLEMNRSNLDSQLGVTRQTLNSDVNIIIKL